MHPATRQFLYGTISIIENALGQMKSVLSAESSGFEPGPGLATERKTMAKSGNESAFCSPEQDNMIAKGMSEIFEETKKGAVNEPTFKRPSDELSESETVLP